jgi:hypothetical protein
MLRRPLSFTKGYQKHKRAVLNPKSTIVAVHTPIVPWHKKLGVTPVMFIAACAIFLALLWYILFTDK